MKTRSCLFLLAGLGAVWLDSAAVGADNAKPAPPSSATGETAQLKPVAVSTVFVSIRLRPFYRDSGTGPRLSRLMVEEVRTKSLAEKAGLVAGMELLAIQGTPVTGLRDVELERLCEMPVVGDTLALKVAEAPTVHGSVVIPREIRVPLAKAAADKPKDLTTADGTKKRQPSDDQK